MTVTSLFTGHGRNIPFLSLSVVHHEDIFFLGGYEDRFLWLKNGI